VTNAVVAFQGWDASGVSWGEDPWGQSLAALPTGTGSVGSVLVDVSGNVSVSVTGVFGTTAIGVVVVPSLSPVYVSGLSATGTMGVVTITGTAGVSLTGVLAQGQIGNLLIWGVVDDSQTPNWVIVNDG